MSLMLQIPEDIELALKLPEADREQQLLCELALALYGRGVLSFSKARQMAGLDRLEFGQLLGRRQIPRHYGEDEFQEDLAYARS